jgi:hypothetical protein
MSKRIDRFRSVECKGERERDRERERGVDKTQRAECLVFCRCTVKVVLYVLLDMLSLLLHFVV